MTNASYALIRLVPDYARGELFNIGILAWNEAHRACAFDDDAFERAAAWSDDWAREDLADLLTDLRSSLADSSETLGQLEEGTRWGPLAISEHRALTADGPENDPFGPAIARLMPRLVSAPQAAGAPSTKQAISLGA